MINEEEHERQVSLVRCMRCGTRKERDRFTEAQLKTWWSTWCKLCESIPIGQLAKPFKDMK